MPTCFVCGKKFDRLHPSGMCFDCAGSSNRPDPSNDPTLDGLSSTERAYVLERRAELKAKSPRERMLSSQGRICFKCGNSYEHLTPTGLCEHCARGSVPPPSRKAPPSSEDIQNALLCSLHGYNGQIDVYADRIVINRKGFLGFVSQGFAGEKTIPMSSIQSVQFKDATIAINGYIQFTVLGGIERRGGVTNAVNDENAVIFTYNHRTSAAKVRSIVESAILSRSSSPAQPAPASSAPISVADELLKFKQLLDMGVLSQSEFDEQKRKLLG